MITFRTLRVKKDLTINYIAEKLGVNPGTVKKYESSEKLPSNKRFVMLQNALECSDEEMAVAFTHHKLRNLKIYSKSSKKRRNKSK